MTFLLVAGSLFLFFGSITTFAFECVVGSLLAVPLLAFLFSAISPLASSSYLLLLIGMCGVWYVLLGSHSSQATPSYRETALDCLLFCGVYALGFQLCLTWPDFYPLGERMRDYALVAQFVHDPILQQEPWLPPYPLPYYGYWYRFGHLLSLFLQGDAGLTYFSLNAFALALLFTGVYKYSRSIVGLTRIGAVLTAVLVTFGSNAEGVRSALLLDHNWWGPSRVVLGGITEFPAWSFLLGDAHPHFLNAGIAVFFLLCISHLLRVSLSRLRLGLIAIASYGFAPLFLFNANAWEVPLWGVLCTITLIALIDTFPRRSCLREEWRDFVGIVLLIVLSLSLYLSKGKIAGDYGIRPVLGAVAASTPLEFFRHWGIPLSMLLSVIVMSKNIPLILGVVGAAVASYFLSDVRPLLFLLLINPVSICISGVKQRCTHPQSTDRSIFETTNALLLVSLLLVLLPELLFFDDPYGDEYERMNTIFKVYAFTWPFFLISSCAQVRDATRRRSRVVTLSTSALVVGISIFFFTRTALLLRPTDGLIKDSANDSANALTSYKNSDGLDHMDILYSGARAAILSLRAQPYGVVIESQGPAYSDTTHVSILSNKAAYLGWANHVNLLTRQYEEVTRRERTTAHIYAPTTACNERRRILRQEQVQYVVFGPIEKKMYPHTKLSAFSCLRPLFRNHSYSYFAVE